VQGTIMQESFRSGKDWGGGGYHTCIPCPPLPPCRRADAVPGTIMNDSSNLPEPAGGLCFTSWSQLCSGSRNIEWRSEKWFNAL